MTYLQIILYPLINCKNLTKISFYFCYYWSWYHFCIFSFYMLFFPILLRKNWHTSLYKMYNMMVWFTHSVGPWTTWGLGLPFHTVNYPHITTIYSPYMWLSNHGVDPWTVWAWNVWVNWTMKINLKNSHISAPHSSMDYDIITTIGLINTHPYIDTIKRKELYICYLSTLQCIVIIIALQ